MSPGLLLAPVGFECRLYCLEAWDDSDRLLELGAVSMAAIDRLPTYAALACSKVAEALDRPTQAA